MDFLISAAHAQQAGAPPSLWPNLILLGVFFLIFWFLLIRPQQKRLKEHQAMVAALQKGDEVITQGGVAGVVRELGDSFLSVEIAPGVEVKIQRPAVTAVLPKGTLKG
ncbi:MAG: preprotein translocase subunit YajC [Xanthomonadales bacterium]|jgi:preprotein translocase subunit YajC|nr:preprotein translocase subunit YajC [Xanthomonadales bacterium]